ncbi:hypothetical protein EVAR_19668_1 [Eumeta japonica]|uniref:Uncharacterized protein n=1 Tax=Eumeta variegata TaxID=151549 RepID=A0A4C1V394_EUMVA|nr:hypothetical protein EVAR_19668_1 [Eumeta japonica]
MGLSIQFQLGKSVVRQEMNSEPEDSRMQVCANSYQLKRHGLFRWPSPQILWYARAFIRCPGSDGLLYNENASPLIMVRKLVDSEILITTVRA